jgi:hypothetical protein
VFYNTIELSAKNLTFSFTFREVFLYSSASSEDRISSFPEYNVLLSLLLVYSVYIRLIFRRRPFVLFELLGDCLPGRFPRFILIIRFRFYFGNRNFRKSLVSVVRWLLVFFGPVILGYPEDYIKLDLVVLLFRATYFPL